MVDGLFIKKQEGVRLTVYDDHAGNKTIGYGHKIVPSDKFPVMITLEQANEIFNRDVQSAVSAIHAMVKDITLSSNQMTALASLVFNAGSGPLLGTIGTALQHHDYPRAGDAFLLWHHAHGKGKVCSELCDALMFRRLRERDLFNGFAGKYTSV